MRLQRFIELRQPVWDEFEARLGGLSGRRPLSYEELEALAADYRRVLHDHALARTRYPGTSVARRLQGLVVEGTRGLSRSERPGGRVGPRRFLFELFPAAFRAQLPEIGVAAALFLAASLFGLVLLIVRPELAAWLVGPERIRELADGTLWTESLTSTTPPSVSSSAIATNNLSVAMTAWAGGALAGIGSLWVLVLNGLHLGSVFGVTAQFSVAGKLGEFVAAHGPLELTLIVVCAGSGLSMARAMLRTDHRSTGERLTEAARLALIVLVGCLPWFVLLGVVESLVSPSPDLGVGMKVALGLALETLFLAFALHPPRSGRTE